MESFAFFGARKKRAVSIVSAPVVEEVPVHEGGGHGRVILQTVMPLC